MQFCVAFESLGGLAVVSLKTRFALLCLLLALITSAVAGIGLHSSSRMGSAIDDLAQSATAIEGKVLAERDEFDRSVFRDM